MTPLSTRVAGATGVFPIKLYAHETPHFTSSPHQYREVFRRAHLAANPKATYYAFDVTIHSRTEVSFVAYDMRDFCYGGIGDVIWRSERVPVTADLTNDDVKRAIYRAAKERREGELIDAEQAVIRGYADEIRSALSSSQDSPV